jgi:hypothetical protein
MRKMLRWPAIFMPLIATYPVLAGSLDDGTLFATVGVCCLIGWTCLGFYQTEETVLKWIWFALYPFVCVGLPAALLILIIGFAMR